MMREKNKKGIIILGSTGSVGEQAVDVCRRTNVRITALSAAGNVDKIERQAREFHPEAVAMANENAAADLKIRLTDTDITVYCGNDGICEMINDCAERFDILLNSIIGQAGLMPTLTTLRLGKRLALANKESLVVAGELVMKTARENGGKILPVDSEHCAIFQCLLGNGREGVSKILLTASGGPFYGYTSEMLKSVTKEGALAHPTWKMGAKITIDSATLMNKGFEIIEASHLFGVKQEDIEVLVHRQSIIHSAVEYIDNSVIAQLSVPDMRHCVQFAIDYPKRSASVCEKLDLTTIGTLTFAKPDYDVFYLLKTARDVCSAGGAVGATLNAANECAIDAFLSDKIPFYKIAQVVTETVSMLKNRASCADTLDGIMSFDREARETATAIIMNGGK